MTEKERQERIAKGYLWEDTDEYLAHQARVKDLMYEFNTSRPSEVDKRRELMKQMFGHVGQNVWINQPLTLAVGSTVSIGESFRWSPLAWIVHVADEAATFMLDRGGPEA